jgi:hypothetical protein
MIEAAEIAVLFPDSTLSQPSSAQLGWSGLAIERRTVQPGEKPEITIGHYFLVLWDRHVAEGESKYRRGQFTPYRKYPNTITTCVPGVRPAARNRSKHEVIVCSIDPAFFMASKMRWISIRICRSCRFIGSSLADGVYARPREWFLSVRRSF